MSQQSSGHRFPTPKYLSAYLFPVSGKSEVKVVHHSSKTWDHTPKHAKQGLRLSCFQHPQQLLETSYEKKMLLAPTSQLS